MTSPIIQGRGSPTWIFVHGGFCGQEDWSEQVRDFSADFRVITLDLPGHGGEPLPAVADVPSLARVLNSLCERQGAADTILVGHSLGCRVVLEAYGQSPANIACIVLIEGERLAVNDPEAVIAGLHSHAASIGLQNLLRVSYEAGLGNRVDDRTRLHVLSRLERIDPNYALALISNTARWDAAQAPRALSAVDVPLLALQTTYLAPDGMRRSIESEAQSPWLQFVKEQVRSASVDILRGAGHFPMIDSAREVNLRLRRFAASLVEAR